MTPLTFYLAILASLATCLAETITITSIETEIQTVLVTAACVCPSTSTSTSISAATTPTDLSTTTPNGCLDFSYDISATEDSVLFPHLIVPVSPTLPYTSFGTIYTPTLNASTTVLYAFDIPATYAGLPCDLLFGLPDTDQLPNSTSYTETGGAPQITVAVLPLADGANVTTATTYADVAAQLAGAVQMGSVTAHGTTKVTTALCAAGRRVVYALSVVDGSSYALTYFQDYGPCAIGLYVVPL